MGLHDTRIESMKKTMVRLKNRHKLGCMNLHKFELERGLRKEFVYFVNFQDVCIYLRTILLSLHVHVYCTSDTIIIGIISELASL